MMEQYDEEEIGGMDLDDHEEEGENGSVVLNSILAEKDTSQADFDAMYVETDLCVMVSDLSKIFSELNLLTDRIHSVICFVE